VGWTEGPSTIAALLTQRNRWQRCLSEAIAKYAYMIANFRYRGFGFFTVPYLLLYEVLGVFFEFTSILLTVVGCVLGVFDVRLLLVFFIFVALTQALITMMSLFAFVQDQGIFRLRFLLYLVLLSLTEFFWYRWLQMIAKVGGTIGFLQGIRNFDQYTRETKSKAA
jgi:cellulose synthase/poly-beta-1,6-N-acetylglucosamine synthase-like glycosyltransferase